MFTRIARAACCVACLSALYEHHALAAFTVNTLADTVADDGVTSLREAITAANNWAGDDIINFSVTGTINLTGALPDLSSNIQIHGPGAASLTVRRNTGGDYGIFTVAGGTTVVLDGLTISNGSGYYGGGILNYGTLAVSNSTLSGNAAAYGGGILNFGTLTVSNSTLSANSAGGGGGGICNVGMLTVTSSTLSGNSSGYYGGGVVNFSGTATLTTSTLTNNSAVDGGGIANGDTLALANCTLSNNLADLGGGISTGNYSTLTNCTLTNNSAPVGGGFRNVGYATLNNTIVANSTLGSDVVNFNYLAGSSNLVEDGSDGLPDTVTGDPILGPLANNGGPTLTYALMTGSPAINAGDNALAINPLTNAPLTTDQRGLARFVGTVDIGAFEVQTVPPLTLINTLRNYVLALVDSGILNKGQGNSLIAKLDGAAQQLLNNKTTPTINKLQAFINEVKALVKSKKLPAVDGQFMINLATAVIAELNSP